MRRFSLDSATLARTDRYASIFGITLALGRPGSVPAPGGSVRSTGIRGADGVVMQRRWSGLMRLRRRRCLMCYWHDGVFVAHGYPHLSPTVLHPVAAEILSAFDDWIEPGKVVEILDGFEPESVEQAVMVLRGDGLLLEEGGIEADEDERIARQWGPWAPEASLYHYSTQDEHYTRIDPFAERLDPAARDEAEPKLAGENGTHTLFTCYPDAGRLLLPRTPARLSEPFDRVLYRRRTHRDFTDEPVPLETLSTLLAVVFGPVDFIDSGRSALMRRTSAAGGSRQELDAYLGIRNVASVPAGIYHYNILEHSLELLSEGLTRDRVVELCGMQEWAGGTAFLVVLSAVIDRMLSKYRSPRSYRVCLLNAGHLGQTFALTATALGLGPFQTVAFGDSAVAEAFGLDNVGHTPMYILAAGRPAHEQTMAPPPAELDTFRRTTLQQ
jgi:SagB-type dehydrogenase family enzyme